MATLTNIDRATTRGSLLAANSVDELRQRPTAALLQFPRGDQTRSNPISYRILRHRLAGSILLGICYSLRLVYRMFIQEEWQI